MSKQPITSLHNVSSYYSEKHHPFIEQLCTQGYAIKPFENPAELQSIQKICKTALKENYAVPDVLDYHKTITSQDQHIEILNDLTQRLHHTNHILNLVKEEQAFLQELLGPDINIQSHPHLRMSRPALSSDHIDLHRDTFLGPSAEFLNVWFPVFPLQPETGLVVLPGSHRIPSKNIREIDIEDSFKSEVERGSEAHKVGFLYKNKTDDTISTLDPSSLKVISPPLNSYIIFFGCMVHNAQTKGDHTRYSVDLRVCPSWVQSLVKDEYLETFSTGVVEQVSRLFNENS